MDQESPPVVYAASSPYKPYVAGLLALIAVLVTAHAYLLHEDVKKCDAFHAAVNLNLERLGPRVSAQELIEAKERVADILRSDPTGCKNVGTSFSSVIEKCMTILFSLITGASLAASSMTRVVAPAPPRSQQER
jgi:hypothetical protein